MLRTHGLFRQGTIVVGDIAQGKLQYSGAKGYVYGLKDGRGNPCVDVQWTSGSTGGTRFSTEDAEKYLELFHDTAILVVPVIPVVPVPIPPPPPVPVIPVVPVPIPPPPPVPVIPVVPVPIPPPPPVPVIPDLPPDVPTPPPNDFPPVPVIAKPSGFKLSIPLVVIGLIVAFVVFKK